MAARDPQKLVVVVRELRELAPGCVLDAVPLDLASLASVRACAETLQQSSIDGLLNNAGVMQQSRVRRQTVDGFEETLQTNVLGPFLLTRLLLPTLERDYEPQRAYKNSKLALLWFTYELARRLAAENVEHVTCSAVCPGFVPATAADSTSGLQRFFLRRVLIHAREQADRAARPLRLRAGAVEVSVSHWRAGCFLGCAAHLRLSGRRRERTRQRRSGRAAVLCSRVESAA